MRRNFIYAMLAAVIIAICSTLYIVLRPLPNEPIVSGFKLFSSFRDFDAPGTVYRVGKDQSIKRVIAFTPDTQAAIDVTYDLSTTTSFSLGQLLQVIALKDDCKPVEGSYDANARDNVVVKSVNGIREITYDTQIDPILVQLQAKFDAGELTYRPDDTYWIIRETIKTNNIDYEARREWLTKASASASLEACENGTATNDNGKIEIAAGSNQSIILKKTFAIPLRGWYSAEKVIIRPTFGASSGNNVVVDKLSTEDIGVEQWPQL